LNEDAEYASWEAFLVGALRAEGLAVAAEEFAQAVEAAITRCDPNAHLAALWRFVRPDVDRFYRLRTAFRDHQRALLSNPRVVRVRPEATRVIPELADRFVLALAANQPAVVLDLLRAEGLLGYFRWPYVSEGMGVAKPALLFFRMILDGLSVAPEEAVMVGDRLDHDVLPAKLLGMRTVRVLVGPYADQIPISPLHCPDRTVTDLAALPAVLNQWV
ncbi:HAD family hydrolase, partial [Candidatus Bipolaricaulota bacterium]|nr:HAD family hydrolase [Candidatus Bipolaricaulota bacterium]